MQLSSKTMYTAFVTSLFALVFALGFIVFAWHITRVGAEVGEVRGNVGVHSDAEEQFRSVRRLAAETAEAREHLNSFFVGTGDVVSFVEDIEDLGRVSGASLRIVSIGVSPGEPGTLHEWLEVVLAVEGSWGAVFRTLELVEHLPFVIVLDGVTMGEIEEGLWRASFTLSVAKQQDL